MRTIVAKSFLLTFVLLAVCCLAREGRAASTVVLSPSGDGVYTLQGIGMEGVATMDIVVSYDPATLTKPRVTQGGLISGAIIAVNDRVPGQVRMGIIRIAPVQGTGTIATLTFDRTGRAAGKILSLTARLSNSESNPLEAAARVSDSEVAAAPASKTGTGETAGAPATVLAGVPPAAASGGPVLPGASLVERTKEEVASAVTVTEPAFAAAGHASPSLATPEAAGMTVSVEQTRGIQQVTTTALDRFRAYRGERTVKAFVELFEQNDARPEFRQEPGVALSDGKATVKLIFVAGAPGGVTPDFALNSARLISMKRDDARPDSWVAEVLPEKGAYSASLILSRNGDMRELPLTLAPKIAQDPKMQGSITEKSFRLYLSGKGRDLNQDGKRDYIDDYIYTANYVAARQAAALKSK